MKKSSENTLNINTAVTRHILATLHILNHSRNTGHDQFVTMTSANILQTKSKETTTRLNNTNERHNKESSRE